VQVHQDQIIGLSRLRTKSVEQNWNWWIRYGGRRIPSLYVLMIRDGPLLRPRIDLPIYRTKRFGCSTWWPCFRISASSQNAREIIYYYPKLTYKPLLCSSYISQLHKHLYCWVRVVGWDSFEGDAFFDVLDNHLGYWPWGGHFAYETFCRYKLAVKKVRSCRCQGGW
jgi:hypothetical protein